jgi:hypothetical protein
LAFYRVLPDEEITKLSHRCRDAAQSWREGVDLSLRLDDRALSGAAPQTVSASSRFKDGQDMASGFTNENRD